MQCTVAVVKEAIGEGAELVLDRPDIECVIHLADLTLRVRLRTKTGLLLALVSTSLTLCQQERFNK